MANKAKTARVCTICKFEDTNKYDYGEWKTYDDCTIHYFCAVNLLFIIYFNRKFVNSISYFQ